jgi:hypothetical protein
LTRYSRKLGLCRLASLSCGALVIGALASACSDVGDDSAIPPGGGVDAGEGEPGRPDTGSSGDASVADVSLDVGTHEDVVGADTGLGAEAGPTESGAMDSPADTTVEETGAADTGVIETGTADTGVEETGTADTSVPDAVGADTGADAADGSGDAGADATVDAGAQDTGGADAGGDVAMEAEAEAGGLVPCTVAGQTGCVLCQHNANTVNPGVCTPTEAILVQHDIQRGLATAPGNDPVDSCYGCLNAKHLLDDDVADTGNECEDPLTTGTAAECHAALSCILDSGSGTAGSSCAGQVVNNCYCGPAAPGSACNTAGSSVNGACASQIAAGLGFPVSDNTNILKNFEDQTRASGIATSIFQGAISNKCNACLD